MKSAIYVSPSGKDSNSGAKGDPLFADVAGHDYTLAPDSPALRLGFTPIDIAAVGPRQR